MRDVTDSRRRRLRPVAAGAPRGPAPPAGWRCSCRSSREVLAATGLSKQDIGFWCSGSSDYLAGRAFSFVSAVDAIGAFPPINESHVEMDAAWALYEAWVKIRTGEAETALVYGFGKSSAGELRRVLALQLDPYLVAPLWPDSVSIAALQARLGSRPGCGPRRTWPRSPRAAGRGAGNPYAQLPATPPSCSTSPTSPTRCGRTTARRSPTAPPWSCSPPATAARRTVRPPGLDHRLRAPGRLPRPWAARPDDRPVGHGGAAAPAGTATSTSPSCTRRSPTRRSCCGRRSGCGDEVAVNPSGGALCGNPMFAAGLARIGEAATQIIDGRAGGRSATPPAGRRCSRTWSA